MNFARLHQIDNETQVLAHLVTNHKDNTVDVEFKTKINGTELTATASCEDLESAKKALEGFNDEHAVSFLQMLQNQVPSIFKDKKF